MTTVSFCKAEANGNDFLIVDAATVGPPHRSSFARYACDRHLGVGADGVEFVSLGDPVGLQLFNADGGEAEISGNGTRCVAAWLAETQGARELRFDTRAGMRWAKVRGPSGEGWDIEIDMGAPLGIQVVSGLHPEIGDAIVLSMGNPQCCVLVRGFPADWERIGADLERHPRFRERTNVAFVHVIDRHGVEVRIFERGVGPTQSSGTGSSAAAVAAIHSGSADSPVEVATPGGKQTVVWNRDVEGKVTLRGVARIVAQGELRLLPTI